MVDKKFNHCGYAEARIHSTPQSLHQTTIHSLLDSSSFLLSAAYKQTAVNMIEVKC